MTNIYSIDHYCSQSTYLRCHYCGTHIWTWNKDIHPDSLITLNHKNNKYFILILSFNVILHRVSQKLLTPTRWTTSAVNLHICVATIAAYRYERGAKEIDQYSIINGYRKNKRSSYFSFCCEDSVTNDFYPLVIILSFSEISPLGAWKFRKITSPPLGFGDKESPSLYTSKISSPYHNQIFPKFSLQVSSDGWTL